MSKSLLQFLSLTDSEQTSGNIEGLECPWCQSRKLSAAAQAPHQFQCFHCKKTGNGYSLLTAFWESLETPDEKSAKELCELKPGLKPEIVQSHLRYDGEQWWMAVRNAEGSIVGLYHYSDSNNTWYSSAAPFSCTVFGIENLKPSGPIHICEGHWDYLTHLSWWKGGPINTIGTGGSSFPQKYLPLLSGRDIVSLNDNDDSGQNGRHTLVSRLKTNGKPKSFKYLHWSCVTLRVETSEPYTDTTLPSGFDLRDLTCSMLENSPLEGGFRKATVMSRQKWLLSCCKPVDWDAVTTVKPTVCRSFEDLLNVYTSSTPAINVTPSFRDCLAICIAVHISIRIDGDPLWFYLVSPPSGGKTTLLEQLAGDGIHSFSLSKFTGLMTGDRRGTHLAPKLNGKCLIIKDGTLLLEGSKESISQIFGELRDIYDGSLAVDYRNGRSASFDNIHFSQLMGMTEAIYGVNTSMLGERYLHCRLEVSKEQEKLRSRQALSHVLGNSRSAIQDGEEEADSRAFAKQRAATAGFLQYLHAHIRDQAEILRPERTSRDESTIEAMADMIACCRAHNENELFDTRPESSVRVVKQLSRLALSLCYVLGTNTITGEVLRLVRKVCHDSCWGQQFRILQILCRNPAGLNRQAISVLTNIPLSSMDRRLKSMERMSILMSETEESRIGRGRKNHVLKVPDWLRQSWELSFEDETMGKASGRVSPPQRNGLGSSVPKKTLPGSPDRKAQTGSIRKPQTASPAKR